MPALVDLLEKPRRYVTDPARIIQALGNIGEAARDAIPALTKAVANTNIWISRCAVVALLQIGEVPSKTIPHIEKQLQEDGYIAGKAAVALWVAERTPERLAQVNAALTSDDPSVRSHAARALAYQNEFPNEILRQLMALLEDERANVRAGAAMALAEAGHGDMEKIIAILAQGVRQGEFQTPCAQMLGTLGPRAVAALPELEADPTQGGSVRYRAITEAVTKIRARAH